MDQLKKLLASLNLRQKITIGASALVVIAAMFAFTRWRSEQNFRPLFSGLGAEDAGAVVQKLRESGTEYRLNENGTILAPSEKIPELRLQMATAGLPRSGRSGFELFDKSNFGLTDFAEHINYRRAIEGELERSVMALAEVEQARVHVTFPKDSVFLDARQPAKASVMLRLRPGAKLAQQNVLGIVFLVASAVDGLAPEAVSVLDMRGNLLNRPRRAGADGEQPAEALLEYKQQIEKDLIAKIAATVEPLTGPEKFRSGVSVECDFSGGEQSEESYDPARSVMSTSQKTEDVSNSGLSSGVPGTASNLPRAASKPGGGGANVTRRTESIAYQTSRTVRRIRLPQGTVKRISASLLVDQGVKWEGSGASARRILEPPSPEKLKVIRDLVAAAIGFTPERGDQLIVETLPFESTLSVEPPAAPKPSAPPASAPLPQWLEPLRKQSPAVLIGAGAAALVLIAAGAALLMRRGRKKRKGTIVAGAAPALPAPGSSAMQQIEENGPSVQQQFEDHLSEQRALREAKEAEILSSLKLPAAATKKSEVLAKYLAEEARKDPASAAHVLRTWLRDKEKGTA